MEAGKGEKGSQAREKKGIPPSSKIPIASKNILEAIQHTQIHVGALLPLHITIWRLAGGDTA
jgi:hypothetical protein